MSLGRVIVAAITGTAAFAAAAAGLSNSSTPTQFGLAAFSAILSLGLAYWQAELRLNQQDEQPDGHSAGSTLSDSHVAHFPRTNLPAPLSSFVGRTADLAVVTRLLQEGRLVTLIGPGGCGKSRLGLEVAMGVAGDYPDGVWLADLAELPDGNLLVERIAETLGVPDDPDKAQLLSLTEYLRPRRLLLILDNCEHVLDACANAVAVALEASANSRLLATSRQPLGVVGEKVMRVGPLATPDPADSAALENAVTYDAVRLFRDRTRDLVLNFEIDTTNVRTVTSICHRLDGIPLAIELAAAKVGALGIDEIAKSLDDRFRLLRRPRHGAAGHQTTLEATIDWSYDFLGPSERRLFNRLSVFSGGWTLEAAQAVAARQDMTSADIRDHLTTLVNRSLVDVKLDEFGKTRRYQLLETLREYGKVHLTSAGEATAIRCDHAGYYHSLLEKAQPFWGTRDQALWLRRLGEENDNIRAALRWWIERGDTERGLELASLLWPFWDRRSHFTEGRRWMEDLLRRKGSSNRTAVRALALNNAGNLAYSQGDLPTARKWYEESILIRTELRDEHGIAGSLNNLGLIFREQGDHSMARALLGRARRLNRAAHRHHWEAINLDNLAVALLEQGQVRCARTFQERSLAIFEDLGDQWGTAMSTCGLASIVLELEGADAAGALFKRSLLIYKEIGDRKGTANALFGLAEVAECNEDLELARRRHDDALRRRMEIGDRLGLARSLESLAELASNPEHDFERAIVLLAAATGLREAAGAWTGRGRRHNREELIRDLRAVVGDERFDSLWTEGLGMPIDVAYAHATISSSIASRGHWPDDADRMQLVAPS